MTMVNPLYPRITVVTSLSAADGNIFAIIGEAQDKLRRAGVPAVEIDQLRAEVLGCEGEFEDAVNVIRKYVNVQVNR